MCSRWLLYFPLFFFTISPHSVFVLLEKQMKKTNPKIININLMFLKRTATEKKKNDDWKEKLIIFFLLLLLFRKCLNEHYDWLTIDDNTVPVVISNTILFSYQHGKWKITFGRMNKTKIFQASIRHSLFLHGFFSSSFCLSAFSRSTLSYSFSYIDTMQWV